MDDRFLIQTAQNVELALASAGVGDRILAWLADVFVWGLYALAASALLDELGLTGSTTMTVLVVLPVLLYHLAFETLAEGQSPGKMLLKIRVARLDGAQPTLGQFALRWLLRFVDVTMSSGTVAVIAVSVSKRQQRLGDVAAGTTVVRLRRRVALDEVRYPTSSRGYTPRFPEAAALSDADIRTIRAVLVRMRLAKRDRRGLALADRARAAVEARLEMAPAALETEDFLEAIVRDHTAVVDAGVRLVSPTRLRYQARASRPAHASGARRGR